jgi:hypothetical protein
MVISKSVQKYSRALFKTDSKVEYRIILWMWHDHENISVPYDITYYKS